VSLHAGTDVTARVTIEFEGNRQFFVAVFKVRSFVYEIESLIAGICNSSSHLELGIKLNVSPNSYQHNLQLLILCYITSKLSGYKLESTKEFLGMFHAITQHDHRAERTTMQ
jgi:hypothetical protein